MTAALTYRLFNVELGLCKRCLILASSLRRGWWF